MKKNIFSVIITALTVINVVLTAVMFFVMLPTFQKTNTLITQVASVLNLELDGDAAPLTVENFLGLDGDAAADPDANYSFEDMKPITVDFGDKDATFNMKTGTDGKEHYALLSGYNLYLNSKADDYDKINEMLTADQTQITGIITNVIQAHTSEDGEQAVIEKEALEKIQELLDSKVAVKLNLNGYVRQ